jgi:dihydrofolate reductase
VHGNPAGDAFFPAVDWADWIEVSREPLARGPNDDFTASLAVFDHR